MSAPTSPAGPRRAGRPQLRQPRLAELVADELRQRILGGEMREGDELPRQEDLLAEFHVSKPSVREALRILETEGLVTVRRGNVGGAVTHVPRAESATYMLALVLESKDVRLRDVGIALQHLEPACASLCAARPDRHTAVLPALRAVQDEAEAATAAGDLPAVTGLALRFHELLVDLCGNETLTLTVGGLESLWATSEQAWAVGPEAVDVLPDPSVARSSLDAHAELIRLVDEGDADGAARAAHRHLERSLFFAQLGEAEGPIDAGAYRAGMPAPALPDD